MTDPRNWISLILLLAVIALLAARRLEASRTEAERQRADSLAAEMAAERARADGWVAMFAEHSKDITAMLSEMDSAYARLLRDYEASNIQVHTYAELLAEAEGTIESLGSRVDSLPVCESGEAEGSWEGSFDDGLLSAIWRFGLPAAVLGLDYGVVIPGEFIQALSGDGRTLVNARALHPRATLNIPTLYVDPLPPEQYCSLGTRGKYAAAGGIVGLLAGWFSCPCR